MPFAVQRAPADGPAAGRNGQDDEAGRVRLAARTTAAETLQELASDPAVTVRAAVAINPAYAPAANQRLATDADERVRALLAAKIATLLPGLSGPDHVAAQDHVHRTLTTLAGDAAVRVRTAVAEALTTMPDVPRDLILTLARDPAVMVSVPVIRLSPLLTDADLLELLAFPAHDITATAIAGRHAISAEVSDSIARHADSAAIQILLQNHTATIQEATLDALIGRAGDHPGWHEPLVCRPILPVRAARALAKIVARHLVVTLVCRADLPPGVARELRDHLALSLDVATAATNGETADADREAAAFADAQRAKARGDNLETALFAALEAGDLRLATAVLATASTVPLTSIKHGIARRSAKAMVSIAWDAGFTMSAAAALQAEMIHLAPSERLAAVGNAFPLSPAEMRWQIELLAEPAK